jgi:peptidoglycan/LPS O-acetylase OafA/YrhL
MRDNSILSYIQELSADAVPVRPSRSDFRPDIEGLRGLAVILTVAFHAGLPGFRGGFLGVDVFFVISGYLITGLLVKEMAATKRIDLIRFYARRLRRILPAASLVLLAITLAGRILFSPLEQSRIALSALAAALFSGNWWFIHERTNYFMTASDFDPFLHMWSLAVEEQFYLFWPVVIMVGLWRGSRRLLVTLLVVIVAASFCGSLWLSRGHYAWAFFSAPARAWELAIGGIACLTEMRHKWLETQFTGWICIAAIVAAVVSIPDNPRYAALAALGPVLGTVLLLGGRFFACAPIRPLEWGAFRFAGRLSYSWYLWSWPLLAFVTTIYTRLTLFDRVMCAAGSFALAALTYKFFENPIRKSRFLSPRPLLSLLLGISLVAGSAVASVAWERSAATLLKSPGQRALADAVKPPALFTDGCMAGPKDVQLRECVRTNPASLETVVLFGDSHAAQWAPAIEKIARDRSWRLVTLTKSGCPAPLMPVTSPFGDFAYSECDEWRELALLRIAEIHPAAVVIGNSARYVVGIHWKNRYSTISPDEWREGMHKTLSRLSSAGITTVLLRDTPWPDVDIPVCLSRALQRGLLQADTCEFDRSDALDSGVLKAEEAAAAGVSGATFLDFSDLLCGPAKCAAVTNGLIAFRDSHHMNAPFAESLSSRVAERLVPAVERAFR